jgi:hypothetical protein
MNDFFGFDFVGILILLCILIYLLFDFIVNKEKYEFNKILTFNSAQGKLIRKSIT